MAPITSYTQTHKVLMVRKRKFSLSWSEQHQHPYGVLCSVRKRQNDYVIKTPAIFFLWHNSTSLCVFATPHTIHITSTAALNESEISIIFQAQRGVHNCLSRHTPPAHPSIIHYTTDVT